MSVIILVSTNDGKHFSAGDDACFYKQWWRLEMIDEE